MNLSQSKFARFFEIPVGTVQRWEQGWANPPIYVQGMMIRVLFDEKVICEEEFKELQLKRICIEEFNKSKKGTKSYSTDDRNRFDPRYEQLNLF